VTLQDGAGLGAAVYSGVQPSGFTKGLERADLRVWPADSNVIGLSPVTDRALHCAHPPLRFALACLVVAAAAPRASASTVDLFGYGARGIAMSGASLASTSGHASVYYNPAGLALEARPSFALGVQEGYFRLRANGEAHDARRAPALLLGLAMPLPLRGWLDRRIALGMGLVIPQNSILIADLHRPGDTDFVVLANRAQTVSIQTALAFRPHDRLSVGVGVLTLAGLKGAVDVAPREGGRLGSSVRDVIIASYSPIIGVHARPTDWLALALTWRAESRADFDFPVRADLGDTVPLPVPTLDIRGTAQFDPAQLAVEVALRPRPWLLVAANVATKRWSAFQNPIVYTAVPEDFPPQPVPAFRDIVVWRVGAEATADVGAWRLLPRLGFAWEPSPVPEQTGFHNYLDNDRVILGAGLGVRWRSLRLDVAAQWHVLRDRTDTKDPALVDDSATNPGFPSISHGGRVVLWALELGAEL
jgi:long-subunit fatty acid transport protein